MGVRRVCNLEEPPQKTAENNTRKNGSITNKEYRNSLASNRASCLIRRIDSFAHWPHRNLTTIYDLRLDAATESCKTSSALAEGDKDTDTDTATTERNGTFQVQGRTRIDNLNI